MANQLTSIVHVGEQPPGDLTYVYDAAAIGSPRWLARAC
jgi:hypothetical protein